MSLLSPDVKNVKFGFSTVYYEDPKSPLRFRVDKGAAPVSSPAIFPSIWMSNTSIWW